MLRRASSTTRNLRASGFAAVFRSRRTNNKPDDATRSTASADSITARHRPRESEAEQLLDRLDRFRVPFDGRVPGRLAPSFAVATEDRYDRFGPVLARLSVALIPRHQVARGQAAGARPGPGVGELLRAAATG